MGTESKCKMTISKNPGPGSYSSPASKVLVYPFRIKINSVLLVNKTEEHIEKHKSHQVQDNTVQK